jgi:hypothetical protein
MKLVKLVTDQPMRAATPVRLVHGGRTAPTPPQVPRHSAPRRRPGERYEAVELPVTDRLREFALQAATAGVDLATAAALAVEARLLLDDLAAAGTPPNRTIELLDRAASGHSIEHPALPAVADYLRHLNSGRPIPAPDLDRSVIDIPLPLRLLARALARPRNDLLANAPADQIVSWEIAAAGAGRTLTEWGLLSALVDRPGQPV